MQRKPEWLKVKLPGGENYSKVKGILKGSSLHTVCEEAKCPNIAECFGSRTATFMILGDVCTRNCLYCNVKHGKPERPDKDEPGKVAKAVNNLGLGHAVITSVTRDDLEDYGSGAFESTVLEIRRQNPGTKIELLIPDFKGDEKSLIKVIRSGPDVIGHNIEVAEKLFPMLRPQGNYKLSLRLLRMVKEISSRQNTKSGFMIGLGETRQEIIKTIEEIMEAGADFLTIGQYLQPRRGLAEVKKFYTPKEFDELKQYGMRLGFKNVESGPLVRSSYRASKNQFLF